MRALARQIPVLLGGEPDRIREWASRFESGRVLGHVVIVVLGAGVYGAAMGWWRSPVQAVFNLVKFPLVILATTLGNALIHGMIAPLLGLDLRIRQSFLLVLMSGAVAASILAALAPIVFFITWNTPSLGGPGHVSWVTYNGVQWTQVSLIAVAGLTANVRLLRLLEALAGNAGVARRVLAAWLAGNLFLGSQLCWILRPFIGSPGLPVEFIRPDAFHGNFYETLVRAAAHLLSTD